MHILFLTDNFPPESNAPATRTYEHAVYWVRMGHKVTVITCAPNFPEGKLYSGYKNSFYAQSRIDGIDVIRVKTFISSNEGFMLRILDFLSFMASSFLAGMFQSKFDVIVATSPQFFTAVSGWLLSAVKRKKFVFELRDIWPASIAAVGAIRDSAIIRVLEKLELFLYRRADSIVSVTQSFKRELQQRGVDANKIAVVVNGVDLSKYKPVKEKDRLLAEKHDLQNKFVVGYIGTHGMAHALEYVIEAAELLKTQKDIIFLFVGSGAAKDNLISLVKSKALSNVVFLPRQRKVNMPRIWSLCDLSVVSLRNTDLFKTVIPSKIFESMGMGLPMVAAIPRGEASAIIEDAGAGVITSPENSQELAEEVFRLANLKEGMQQYANASANAARLYDRKLMAEKMANILLKLTNN